MKKYMLPLLVLITTQAQAGGSNYSDKDTNDLWSKTDTESQAQYQAILTHFDLPEFTNQIKIISSTGAKTTKSVYAEIFKQASQDLQKAEALISIGDFAQALAVSKVSLDSVRTKVGINPKAKVQEKFAINYVALNDFDSKEKLDIQFQNLNLSTRDGIVMTLAQKNSGYYLDFLNLMKRTNLVYIRAFTESIKKQASDGKLLKRDIEKIRDDIAEISAIPIYFFEPATGKMLLIFDFEVANSDQNYLFNRELFIFMLANPNIFGAKDEKEADLVVAKKVEEIRGQFRLDLQKMEINFTKIDDSLVTGSDTKLESYLRKNISGSTDQPELLQVIRHGIASVSILQEKLTTKNPAMLLNFKSCLSTYKSLRVCKANNSCDSDDEAPAIFRCSIYSPLVLQAKSADESSDLLKCFTLAPGALCPTQTYDLDLLDYDAIKRFSSTLNRTAFGIGHYLGIKKVLQAAYNAADYLATISRKNYNERKSKGPRCLQGHWKDRYSPSICTQYDYETYQTLQDRDDEEYLINSKKIIQISDMMKSYTNKTLTSLPQ